MVELRGFACVQALLAIEYIPFQLVMSLSPFAAVQISRLKVRVWTECGNVSIAINNPAMEFAAGAPKDSSLKKINFPESEGRIHWLGV